MEGFYAFRVEDGSGWQRYAAATAVLCRLFFEFCGRALQPYMSFGFFHDGKTYSFGTSFAIIRALKPGDLMRKEV